MDADYLNLVNATNYYYTVACIIVNDVQIGTQKLMDPNMQWIITGGVTTDCLVFPFFPQGPGLG